MFITRKFILKSTTSSHFWPGVITKLLIYSTNPISTLRWNSHKSYLVDKFKQLGLPTIESLLIPKANPQSILEAFEHFKQVPIILKIAMSAGGFATVKLKKIGQNQRIDYARIDLVKDLIMEVKLIEPDLFLSYALSAGKNLFSKMIGRRN